MSGRCGGYVYYWAYGRLCWRVYVIPKDPRTTAQQRSRAAFGAASRAWSASQPLTHEQRDAWHAEAAKIKTRPRLAQSGLRTVQQYFVGRNSLKERWGLPLLLEPPGEKRSRNKGERRIQDSLHKCSNHRALYDPHGSLTGPAPDLHRTCPRQPKRVRRNPSADLPPRNWCSHSALRDPPRTASIPPPGPFRCSAGGSRCPRAPSEALVCPVGRPPSPKCAATPTPVNSGAAASVSNSLRSRLLAEWFLHSALCLPPPKGIEPRGAKCDPLGSDKPRS